MKNKGSKNTTKRVAILLATWITFSLQVLAQEIRIELGPDNLAENQVFTITITVENDRIRSHEEFPDISGLVKRGTSSSSRTNIVNGQMTSSQSITMNYSPQRQGEIFIRPFSIKVNDKVVESPGKKLVIGPPQQRPQRTDPFSRDPFQDFFGRREEPEFVEVQDDAFFALTTSKDEIFVGEGVTVTLAFYVADANRATLQFHELGKQLSEIVKKIRPANCWEENFNIENITSESVLVNNRRYAQYKVFQATFYPLNADDLGFPSVGLEMIKYRVARNPSFFGQNRQEDFKTFHTKPKVVKVKALPAHPLRDKVSVGDYRLDETLGQDSVLTGESFTYEFGIYGEGNIAGITKPELTGTGPLEFYEPNIGQNINRRVGRVTGAKVFGYFGIPNEPGVYPLSEVFEWIFFNPRTAQYDTLRSTKTLRVIGESKRNQSISSSDQGSFYDALRHSDNTLRRLNGSPWPGMLVNFFILVSLLITGYLFFRKRS
jgi:hypothetical protein